MAEDSLSADKTARRPSALPAFIACNARSGSTLLRWLVDTSPEIACPAETDVAVLLESYMASARAVGLDDALERARMTADDLMQGYVTRSGKSRWCDKSLSNVLHLDTLAQAWPDARFLMLHRHCMDFVMSALEAQPWGLKDYGFAQFAAVTPSDSVTALAAYWIDRTAKMLTFEERYPDRCLRVRYEDLVLDADGVLATVWPFLGVAPVEDVAAAAFRAEHDAFGPADYKLWYTEAIHDGSVGRGGRVPPDRVPGLARRTVNEILGRLGYELIGDDWGSGGLVPRERTDAAPGSVGGGRIVELRIVDGYTTVVAEHVDLAVAPVAAGSIAPQGASASLDPVAVSAVVAIERATLDELCSGRENIGAALRARTVRYYGPTLVSFEEERRIFDHVAEHLAVRRPYFTELFAKVSVGSASTDEP